MRAEGVPIVGRTDHGWTKSLYIEDPDGVEIELYIDGYPSLWRNNPDLAVQSIPLAL